ncbi:MAG: twin-arginine translocase TatA/TatE family subunit [Gammaproteobacteria bacterium]
MGIGITELLVILAIVAVLFGTKKLRNIGGDLGSAIKSFRSAMGEADEAADKRSDPGRVTQDKDSDPQH